MAVVFISPKHKQKMFFMGITASFIILLTLISLWIFLSKPSAPPAELVFNKPKVSIDLKILDTEQFKKIEHFQKIPLQFKYTASTANGQTTSGFVSAVSEEEAKQILENAKLKVGDLKQTDIGRDNPFIPYYQIVAPTTTKATKK